MTGATAAAEAEAAPPTAGRPPANLMFSHMGISVNDIERMSKFYTDVLGFTITDHGDGPSGMKLVFMSRDPMDHHQIVLAEGRPDEMPANTLNTRFGPSINQISFKMGSIADLRDIKERLERGGATALFPANHGISWSVYAHDPEGNNLEFFVESDWYFPQPFLIPMDLSKSDQEIYALTETLSKEQEGFEPFGQWRERVAARMTPFMAPPFKG